MTVAIPENPLVQLPFRRLPERLRAGTPHAAGLGHQQLLRKPTSALTSQDAVFCPLSPAPARRRLRRSTGPPLGLGRRQQ
ncbi:MAG: hypothetical protein R2856_00245 [Caldilineaceae bacterium]